MYYMSHKLCTIWMYKCGGKTKLFPSRNITMSYVYVLVRICQKRGLAPNSFMSVVATCKTKVFWQSSIFCTWFHEKKLNLSFMCPCQLMHYACMLGALCERETMEKAFLLCNFTTRSKFNHKLLNLHTAPWMPLLAYRRIGTSKGKVLFLLLHNLISIQVKQKQKVTMISRKSDRKFQSCVHTLWGTCTTASM